MTQFSASYMYRIKGVESVGLGFSTERDGYWPVIRVIVDEKTCEEMKTDKERKTTLTHEVTAALKEVLTQLHPSTSWDEKEVKDTIEIVIPNRPLKAYELCSAGDVIETTYSFDDNKINRRLGTMGYSVCHKVTIGEEVYTDHYEVTAYHPLMPSHSLHFQQTLPPIPTTNTPLPTSVKYQYITECPDQDVAIATSPPNDSLLVPTLLRATIFPQQTKYGFQLLQQQFSYTNNVYLPLQAADTIQKEQAELVVGKSGLVKYKLMPNDNQNYECNIVENQTKIIHDDHPCNIDVAVLKYSNNQRSVCSIKESFSHYVGVDWSGPPGQSIEERKGRVVYFTNGTAHRLSDSLIKFNDPPEPDEYPGYVWKLADNVVVPPSHSGAPVFLIRRNSTTLHLLGNLITATSASPLIFSLDMIRDEIAIHHIDQILGEQLNPEMIKRLKQYKEYLMWHSKEQSLTPLIEGRYICCDLSICIHPPYQNTANNDENND